MKLPRLRFEPNEFWLNIWNGVAQISIMQPSPPRPLALNPRLDRAYGRIDTSSQVVQERIRTATLDIAEAHGGAKLRAELEAFGPPEQLVRLNARYPGAAADAITLAEERQQAEFAADRRQARPNWPIKLIWR